MALDSEKSLDLVEPNLMKQREMVEVLPREYSVRQICEVLGFTPSNLYYHVKQAPSEAMLGDEIETLAVRYPTYGYRRITKLLLRRGYSVGYKRVARLMKAANLSVSVKRCPPLKGRVHGSIT